MNKRFLGNSMLVLTALIWGCAFVAQSIGMDYVEPFTFSAVRSLLGATALIPVILIFDRINRKRGKETGKFDKTVVTGGVISGLFLGVAINLQQIGLVYTSAGKAGFVTALYIVLVPICGIFLHKKIAPSVWISVLLATGGLYLLCINETLAINKGDIFVFLCAFAFTAQILAVDYYAPLVDGVRLSCVQFYVCGLVSLIGVVLWEHPIWADILAAWKPILYTAFLSTSVGYTLQIIAQKYTEPTIASLLMSFESVFATLAGFVILHEVLSERELFGCVIMFIAVILAQIPQKFFVRKKKI